MRATAAQEPLALIRRLYDAWNSGDVATAAEVLAPDVRWDTFGGAKANAMQQTLAGGSGGTWHLTAVAVDLLVGIEDHVLAFSRRTGAAPERIEIWTLKDGRAVHYRGYPLDDGLAVLSETTGSRKLELVCRAVVAFNRGDKAGWMRIFTGDGRAFAQRLEGTRLDDIRVLGETFDALVLSAAYHHGGQVTPVHLLLTFAGERARRVEPYPTAADALDAAARWSLPKPVNGRPGRADSLTGFKAGRPGRARRAATGRAEAASGRRPRRPPAARAVTAARRRARASPSCCCAAESRGTPRSAGHRAARRARRARATPPGRRGPGNRAAQ